MRRVLADASAAHVIPSDEARKLIAEGHRAEPVGGEMEPPKLIVFVQAARLARIASARPVPVRLSAELLTAGCLALTPFDPKRNSMDDIGGGGGASLIMSLHDVRPATYEDLLKVPDHLVAEILDGALYATPRPAPRHAVASSGLGGALHGPFDRGRGGPGGCLILDEPELHLGADVLVPDLAGWRRERMPAVPEEAYFSLAPD